jgi:hypothetical protein
VLSGVISGVAKMSGVWESYDWREFFFILDLHVRHRVFKHSLTAVHLSADLGASADVDSDGGVATGPATTFYLVIWQHSVK